MADSEADSQIASGESSGSAMSVQSAELSATSNHELSNHVLSQLPPETIVPSVKTHCALPKSLRGAATCAERPYMTGEKKRRLDIPGRDGTTIDGETPLDLIIAKCQFPEMLARYRHVEGRFTSWLMAFSSNAHATGRDLSFPHLFSIKLVMNYREAWDRCCFYYTDEAERTTQWNNFLMLIDAGAEEDTDSFRKLVAQLTPMLIPPSKGANSRLNKVTADVRYQTLWTDLHWNDGIRETYILEGTLPADFNLSRYYRESRDMLVQESAKKQQQQIKVKKVESGSPVEDFRVKRLLDPIVDPNKLNHAQLVTLVEKQQVEISAQQQELNNYERSKKANNMRGQRRLIRRQQTSGSRRTMT